MVDARAAGSGLKESRGYLRGAAPFAGPFGPPKFVPDSVCMPHAAARLRHLAGLLLRNTTCYVILRDAQAIS